MAPEAWKETSEKAQQKLAASIPSDWRIGKEHLPPSSQTNVTSFPAKSGLLSGNELTITESYATDIVKKIATGQWSSENVTKAFCKRAAIAHQMVCFPLDGPPPLTDTFATDELLDSSHV